MSGKLEPTSVKPPCRYFAKAGNCFYGDACNFAHVKEGSPVAVAMAPPAVKPSSISLLPEGASQATPFVLPSSSSAGRPWAPSSALSVGGISPIIGNSPILAPSSASAASAAAADNSPLSLPSSAGGIRVSNVSVSSSLSETPASPPASLPPQQQPPTVSPSGIDLSQQRIVLPSRSPINPSPPAPAPALPSAPSSVSAPSSYSISSSSSRPASMLTPSAAPFKPQQQQQQAAPLIPSLNKLSISSAPGVAGATFPRTFIPKQQQQQQAPSVRSNLFMAPGVSGVAIPFPASASGASPSPSAAPRSSGPPPPQQQHHLPHMSSAPVIRTVRSLSSSEEVRRLLTRRAALRFSPVDRGFTLPADIPSTIRQYHSLQPLEKPDSTSISQSLNCITHVFKAYDHTNGSAVVLRRCRAPRINTDFVKAVANTWKAMNHPGLVPLKDAFIGNDFGIGNEIIVVSEYIPIAETLAERFIQPFVAPPPEPLLWSIACQLASVLRRLHSAGFACRSLDVTKVLISNDRRVHVNCGGVMDMLWPETQRPVGQVQYDDIHALARLLACIATRALPTPVLDVPKVLGMLREMYSTEFVDFITGILSPDQCAAGYKITSIVDVMRLLATKFVDEMDSANTYSDFMESELSKELENGRLLRLLVKLGYINERPDFDTDPNWSETGDQYLLKLFRDFVFHQSTEEGAPMLDFGHVVDCLNKLDAGTNEKILMMSRDQQTILVATYKDIKRCLEAGFSTLVARYRSSQEGSSAGY